MRCKVSIGEPKNPKDTVVLVDTIRSSTTIARALENGAKFVVPFKSSEKIRQVKKEWSDRGNILLVGEEFGKKPKGFDMNISPRKMTEKIVKDKMILYRSTNLTRVLEACRSAKRVIIGGLINSKAVGEYINKIKPKNVEIIACGISKDEVSFINKKFEHSRDPENELRMGDTVSMEDMIGAGAIVNHLKCEKFTDLALISQLAYKNENWKKRLKEAYIPRHAKELDLEEDIIECLKENQNNTVPILKGDRIIDQRRREK